MPFIRSPGLPGKLYIPATGDVDAKKHPCPDCFACQRCGEDRCQVCRSGTTPRVPSEGNKIHDPTHNCPLVQS